MYFDDIKHAQKYRSHFIHSAELDTSIATTEDEEHNNPLDRNLEPSAHVSDPSAL